MEKNHQIKFVTARNRINDMENQIFTPWQPTGFPMNSRVSFEGIIYGINGMRIDVREESGEKRFLSLCFADLPTAVRIADEGMRLTSLSSLPRNVQNSFYLVQHSEFLKWLNTESLFIHENDPIFHLAIVTDEWIDLICNEEPIITTRDAVLP